MDSGRQQVIPPGGFESINQSVGFIAKVKYLVLWKNHVVSVLPLRVIKMY